jgi:hypothetical protein
MVISSIRLAQQPGDPGDDTQMRSPPMRNLPSQDLLDTITAGELKVAARIGLDTWTRIEANATPALDDDLLTLDDLLTVTGAEELTVYACNGDDCGQPLHFHAALYRDGRRQRAGRDDTGPAIGCGATADEALNDLVGQLAGFAGDLDLGLAPPDPRDRGQRAHAWTVR